MAGKADSERVLVTARTVKAVTTSVEFMVKGETLIRLLRSQGYDVPADAKVRFRVPGGGGWSNHVLDLDEYPVTVKFATHTQDETSDAEG